MNLPPKTTALGYLRSCIHNLEQLLDQEEIDTLVKAIADPDFGVLFRHVLDDIQKESPVLSAEVALKLVQVADTTLQIRIEETRIKSDPWWQENSVPLQTH